MVYKTIRAETLRSRFFFCTAQPFLSNTDTGSPISDGKMADHVGMIDDRMLGPGNTASVPTFTL